MFKFPDGGRRRFFSALEREGGRQAGEPPFSFLDSRPRGTAKSKGDSLVPRRVGGANRKSQAPPQQQQQPTASQVGVVVR